MARPGVALARRLRLLTYVFAAGLGACGNSGSSGVLVDEETPDTTVNETLDYACMTCHGRDGSSAPPLDLRGHDDPAARGVGAHTAHLSENSLGADIPCGTCHVVPGHVDDEGHADSSWPAEVTFSALASANGALPALHVVDDDEASSITCRSIYCHGATLSGGSYTEPRWNPPDERAARCDSCHGAPPPGPHPPFSQCSVCHPTVAAPDGSISDRTRHIDGTLDVAMPSECDGCHGSAETPAPPPDLSGSTNPDEPGVGVHRSHLFADHHLSAPVACDQCHVVPPSVNAPGHLDDGAAGAEITFGALAGTGDASPEYDADETTCSSVYCHGATLAGGSVETLSWTHDSVQAVACGACHGVPPPSPHVHNLECGLCHSATADGMSIVHPEHHVDGILDLDTDHACTTCHGSAANEAPPVDTTGGTSTVLTTVGAHQSHLLASSNLTVPVACAECHVTPVAMNASGHIDAPPAELTFGELATTGGASPSWSTNDATCSSVYCHGATLAGGSKTSPLWTKVDGTQDTCGSCHGVPPPAPHSQSADCGMCHKATASGMTIAHPDKHIDGKVEVETDQSCHDCHGSALNGAPPLDTTGNSATTLKTVGAHQAHLLASSEISAPIACTECHVIPTGTDEATHIDTPPAELTFGELASAGDLAPTWRADAGTCSSTYCHGATLTGGTTLTPLWTKVDGTQDACGACHGVPPPPPHVQTAECGLCHSETASGMTITHPEKHLNGVLEVDSLQACNTCHGGAQNSAPPVDTTGGADTALVTVGAHQAHLLASSGLSSPILCEQCHVRPTAIDQPGHLDAAPAELTFGDLATADGATPEWNHLTETCSSTYCHGVTLTGGVKTDPVWTVVDNSQNACGACHGIPPPAPHVQRVDCGMCHSPTAVGMAIVHPEKHIDGVLDVGFEPSCNACHGSVESPAPPEDLTGGSSTTLTTVGAHQSHLQGSSGLSSPVACAECHVVPLDVTDAGHLGAAPAEVTFGALASSHGVTPSWSPAAASCATTYCHGTTLEGGFDTTPVWTQVDNTQDACGACHGIPPPAPHVQNLACGSCHAATATGTSIAHPEKHIDGVLQVATDLSCHACHGSADNDAPPTDTTGGSSTALTTVGAHQPHLLALSGLSAPLDCTACHVEPAAIGDAGHIDAAPAELTFGELAKTAGASPSWQRTSATCSTTYCHGATLTGGALTAPAWTTIDGTQDACGSCHGVPPPVPHVQSDDCGACHPSTAEGAAIAHPEKHIDGVVQVVGGQACNACHGNADNAAPPIDTAGDSDTTLVTVGAHQQHLLASSGIAAPVACTECHVKPAAVGAAGHLDAGPAEVTFGDLASSGGAVPAWDHADATCSSTYCHGATLEGGTATAPVWTQVDGTQAGCGACHGAPPPAPHVQSTDCGLCHGGTAGALTITNPDKHLDGVLQVDSFTSCNACHGSDANPAPPVDTAGGTVATLVTVGAHQAHVLGSSGLTRPLDCSACHVKPATVNDPGHIDGHPSEVTFGALAGTNGASPHWSEASATCSSTYCHGATLTGGTVPSPDWTSVDDTADTCGACHGVPPPLPHAQRSNCGLCHSATAKGMAIIDLDKHLDGVVEVDEQQACTACHGSLDNPAPPHDTEGGEATSLRTVGAHQSHVRAASGLSKPVPCEACHVTPAAVGDLGHVGPAPAEVTFGMVAVHGGASPTWSTTDATCSSTYCHGASLTGGTLPTPKWTRVDGTQAVCGSCHGVPPPAPHVQVSNCGLCHSATAEGGGIAHPDHHVDGVLDVDATQACNSCHGNANNAAPPVDTTGGSSTLLTNVGAHQAHVRSQSNLSSPVPCSECHVTPVTTLNDGHIDAAPAEVTFGTIATAKGVAPNWNRTTGTCSTTYCHGATLEGGVGKTPIWTKVDNTQDACGSCHGVPPPAPHVQDSECGECHPSTAIGSAIAHPEKHIDGTLQVDMPTACNACHGSATSDAPPVDTTGGSSTVLTTVGAHQAHLKASSALAAPLACAECHDVPSTVNAAGHIDAAPADLAFGTLAGSGTAAPTWNHATNTCSSVYCHGATLTGGVRTTPTWTKVDNTQDACGSCHGLPPPAPHVQSTNCGMCHSATTSGVSIAHPENHVDGTLNVDPIQACNACHGSAANDAPPKDSNGGTSTLLTSIGAHQAHVISGSAIAAPVGCAECHVMPATVTAEGHIDASPAEVVFGLVAKAGGAAPTWSAASAMCSSTYCHGASLAGGSVKNPSWTKVDNSQDTCASCHGNPPPAPHVQTTDCGQCHAASATGGAITTPANHVNGVLDVDLGQTCNTCHGSVTNDAPPLDTTGGSATTLTTIGAHQEHLLASSGLSAPLACSDCHVVPLTSADSGHVDAAPAEVAFGLVARADGAAPTWNRITGTCSSTYCHGGTLNDGGTATTPVWTKVDHTQDTCASCHGNPPTAPHVQHANCGLCHSASATGAAITQPLRHVDGVVDVDANQACNACHGDATSDAPPIDTNGGSATTLTTVGAHQAHLKASSGLASPVPCTECHVHPTATNDAGHIGNPPAELTFGALATTGGAVPAWTRSNGTCSSTYCHGATLNAGGTRTSPVWTKVDGSQDACGACHGNPPPSPHVQNANCGLCHSATATAGAITHAANHINGTVDVDAAQACNACHGSAANDAPPVDTTGGSATTLVTVGAHQAHVTAASDLANPLDCSACHLSPSAVTDAGHLDTAPAEVSFGTLAEADGAAPVWTRGTATCSSTYCHGATLNAGGTATAPSWTKVDGTQDACTSCHGNPPPSPHVAMADCGLCHGATATGAAVTHPATHIDGELQVTLPSACNACHGDATNAAPPVDLAGGSATTAKTVGAHQAHLLASSGLSTAVACTECHKVPATVDGAGHIDASPAEVAFGALSKTGGLAPAWNAVAATCSSTYCHGASLNAGGSVTTPLWTRVDNTQDTCTSCHGNPPPAPHSTSTACASCHPDTMNANGTIKAPAKHINGTVEVASLACNSCHGSASNNAPPVDTAGSSTTTLKTVGAHQAHLLASSGLASPVACAECHVVPATMDAAGHLGASPAEVVFGTFTKTGGLTPVWSNAAATCSSTYCHGASLNAGGVTTTPLWTKVDNTQDSCTSCHGNPPPAPHSTSTACATCHPDTMNTNGTIKTPAKHINGTVEVVSFACNSCHGSTANNAPPVDTTGGAATTLKTVGAHQAHLLGSSSISSAIACAECHVVPATLEAAGHLDTSPAEVVFGALTKTGGLTPVWSNAAATCSSTYCHGASLTLAGGSNKAPVWTTVNNTQDACGTCHASATSGMTRPHPVGAAGSTCATCHGTTMTDNSAFKNKALHVNGAVEIAPPSGTLSCNGVCHGVTTGAAPANQAPPADTQGLTAVTLKSVGDHQNHLLAPALISSAMACNECHPVPTAIPDAATPAHLNKAVDVSFTIGTLSKKVAATTYSATTASCTRSYCHGGWTNSGAANTSETWTTGTALSGCTNRCHGLPPSTGRHRRSDHLIACGRCHADVAKTSTPNGILTTTAARALHINGNPDVRMSGGGSWNATTRSCSPSGCHGSESWGARVLPL